MAFLQPNRQNTFEIKEWHHCGCFEVDDRGKTKLLPCSVHEKAILLKMTSIIKLSEDEWL